ncbi:MAG TPA: PEP/pyruvate-binding domain-containing protein [Bacteroidota bacterium]
MNRVSSKIRSLFSPLTARQRNTQSFEEQFNLFREVLDRNNRSLEIITEMGEMLGGDYLFDSQYLTASYDRLSADLHDSLSRFDLLTGNRYFQLHDRLSQIDGQIRHAIEDTTPASDALVLSYENIAGDMLKAVGGKNSSLAEIKTRLKVRVPDAFAVTARSCEAFLEQNRIIESFPSDGSSFSPTDLRRAQELILQGAIPAEVTRAIDGAVKALRSRCGADSCLAVRSSAGEEDGDFSFAGQFETVLNVPLETPEVEKAYRRVIASLFSEKAALYQRQLGYGLRDMKMAVACVAMVDAVSSGVLYTSDPQGDRTVMIINAAWGLGSSIVEGQTDADYFRVKKEAPGSILETRIGAKESQITALIGGGVARSDTPNEKKSKLSLSHEQIAELAPLGVLLERHFRRPQDIEWAIDRRGKLFILQSRPLRLPENNAVAAECVAPLSDAEIIAKHKGLVVQKGVAAGPIFIVKNEQDLDAVPRGAILVARRDSSGFVRVMTEIAAIITETGTPTSHMAALCREFRIPTVVNAGAAAQKLKQGQEITILVESDGATLYDGVVSELVEQGEDDSAKMGGLIEFRKKRYLLRYVAPLNLVDPLRDEFTPQACRTMHDILRFIHEKSVAELIETAGKVKKGAVKLDLAVSARIMMIDIGGGLRNPAGLNHIGPERIASLPFRAIISGMMQPGVWRSDTVSLTVKDFMSGMLRAPDITAAGRHMEQSLAIVSREYANLNFKFGYHFIVLDCYCSEKTKNNHIYFRFAGGASDMSKRSRRLQLIAAILGEYGFNIKTKGDFIIARLANIRQADAESVLDQIGRLFSYTRQIDAVLNDDDVVERLARSFQAGNYELAEAGGR